MMDFRQARNVRREARSLVGRFRGGTLAPVMITAVKGNEGGMLTQTCTYELDPIMGRMITPITAEFIAVFVPLQAMDVLKNPAVAYAGVTEVVKEKLLTGSPLFGLEAENVLSQRMGVIPRRISNVLRVSEMVKLGHNCAVNHLRRRKYWRAALLTSANVVVTPALLSDTVLDRFNAVLDPDDRINGSVTLNSPSVRLPVRIDSAAAAADTPTNIEFAAGGAGRGVFATNGAAGQDPLLELYALWGGNTSTISLAQFNNAKTADDLVRIMDNIMKANPEYGDELVLRWAHGMTMENGSEPWVIAERQTTFQRNIVGATDTAGITAETMRSDFMVQLGFTVPVPKTELGGVIVTFAVVKPDETLSQQPHPILSDNWTADNFVAEELLIDPQPVTMRELNASVPTANETTVAFWTGLNEIYRNYVHYGLNRQVAPATLTNKTALWQYEVPLSVTPESILYPASLAQAPFVDTGADVVTYTVTSQLTLKTPMQYGPTPVETLAIIDNQTLLT